MTSGMGQYLLKELLGQGHKVQDSIEAFLLSFLFRFYKIDIIIHLLCHGVLGFWGFGGANTNKQQFRN
jgi:hypothetical protein